MVDEQKLEAALEAEVSDIQPTGAMWEAVRKRTHAGWRWRFGFRGITPGGKAAVVAAAVLLLFGVVAGGNAAVANFRRPTEPKPIVKVRAHAVGQPQGPDEVIGNKPSIEVVSLAQAKAKVDYALSEPTYLPDGRTVEVQVLTEATGQRVAIFYETKLGTIAFQQWKGDPKLAPYMPNDQATTVKIGSVDGHLSTYTDRGPTTTAVLWEKDGKSFSLHSTLGADELLKVARSVN